MPNQSDATETLRRSLLAETEAAHHAAAALLAGIEDPNEYWGERAKAVLAAAPWMPPDVVLGIVQKARAAGAGFAGKSDEQAAEQLRERATEDPFPLPRDAVFAWVGRVARVRFGDPTQTVVPVWVQFDGTVAIVDENHICVTPLQRPMQRQAPYGGEGRVPLAHIKEIEAL